MTKQIWDKFFKKNKQTRYFGKSIFDYSKPDKDIVKLVNLLKKEKVKKILDLGCGEGRNSEFLARKGFLVTGIDISKIAIQKAKRKNSKIKYLVGDMRKLPFRENLFDAVISTQTIFHGLINDIRKTIREIRLVTKNEGIIFITLQPTKGNKFRMGKKLENNTFISKAGDDAGEIHHFFTKLEIKKEFQKFKILDLFLRKSLIIGIVYLEIRNRRRASFTGTKFGGGKRGWAKIPPPNPLPFCPPERKGFCFCRAKRGNQNSQSGFSSKKVRILTKRHRREQSEGCI